MMKSIYNLGLSSLLLTSALSLHADDGSNSAYEQQTSTNTSNVATYLLNLGADLGYDLTQPPPAPPTPISPVLSSTAALLLGASGGGATQQLPFFTSVFDAFLGAVPVNSLFMQFVPSTNATYAVINGLANATFPSYDNTSSQQSNALSVNPAIDQQTFQQDPVSQAVLNILGTPSYSYCMNYDGTTWTGGSSTATTTANASQYPKCELLYQYQVMNNTIGTLPTTYQFYTYEYNQQFLSQLNGNTLIAPLLYSTTNPNTQPTSSSPQQPPSSGAGLPAQSQAQQEANFIRYVTGAVAPLSLPKLKDYDSLYTQAVNVGNSVPLATQMQAQGTLTSYFAKLRTYAAQSSVGYSNLYYILSKRMPQTTPPGSNSGTPTSQALNEFTMASWRLYTPGGSANTNWLSQINQASPATVQKEMVTLLAEINYQMYLTRQQEERLLLTNTMLLLLSSRSSQPTAPSLDNPAPPQ